MKLTKSTSILLGFLAVQPAIAQDSVAPQTPQATTLGPPVTTSLLAGGAANLIYTTIGGYPESLVPGLSGVEFKPGTSTLNLDRVYGSPNGNWILTGLADLATTGDEVLIVNGSLMQQEGQPGPWTGGLENCGTIDTRCDVNDAGDFTFATNTDGPTTADDYIVTNVGGVWGYSAKEGDPVPGLAGNTYDDTLDSALILDDGSSGFFADGIDGTVTTAEDEIAMLGSTILMQMGVTIPTGQAGGATEFMEFFDFQDFWASGDGTSWLVQGDLTGSTANDDVVIVNGAVVLQEDSIIPGSGFANPIDGFGIEAVHMDDAGNWYARGNNDGTEQDWVVRNGSLLTAVGDPIITGSTELWDDTVYTPCFFLHVGNTLGDYVLGGVTDNADPLMNGVLVLNGTTVICREGDPVDLDSNGMFDDDAFINTFGNDDGYLTDAGIFYMVVSIKNGAGTTLGQGFFSIDTGAGSTGVAFCDPMDPNSTGASTTLTGSFGSGVGSDLHLEATSGPPTQFGYFLVGTAFSEPGLTLSQGRLCLSVGVGEAIGRYNVPGGALNSLGSFDASGVLQNLSSTSTTGSGYDVPASIPIMGAPSIMSGETWHFQLWHRENAGLANFSNGLSVTF